MNKEQAERFEQELEEDMAHGDANKVAEPSVMQGRLNAAARLKASLEEQE